MKQDRFLPLGQKSLFIPGCVQGAVIMRVIAHIGVIAHVGVVIAPLCDKNPR